MWQRGRGPQKVLKHPANCFWPQPELVTFNGSATEGEDEESAKKKVKNLKEGKDMSEATR